MKPVKASLHAPKVRFMIRRIASYGKAVLHLALTDEAPVLLLHETLFRHYEGFYTLSYIDRMWNLLRKEPFPPGMTL